MPRFACNSGITLGVARAAASVGRVAPLMDDRNNGPLSRARRIRRGRLRGCVAAWSVAAWLRGRQRG